MGWLDKSKSLWRNTKIMLKNIKKKNAEEIFKIHSKRFNWYNSTMKDKINPDNDGFDPSEEYFRKKDDSYEKETEEYYPQDHSKPPHY